MPDKAVDERFGIALGYAVDRMRDLVRRAIRARLCLAAEPDGIWPFSGYTAVDSLLSDDARRARWRASWHEKLAALGVGDVANPPRGAVEFFSADDR